VFEVRTYPASRTATEAGRQLFRCTGADNHLFNCWWHYRQDADSREFVFHNGAGSGLGAPLLDPDGDAAVLTWTDCDGRGFDAELRMWVYSTGTASGVVSQRMQITNRTAVPITFNLYSYADLDVCGSLDDSAVFLGPLTRQHEVRDGSCAVRCCYLTCQSTSYRTGDWPAVLDSLTNGTVDNLTGTGMPFASGDWSSASQWRDVLIGPGASFTASAAIAVGFLIPCCQPASTASHCAGKAGTVGIPRWAGDPWPVGGRVALTLHDGLPGAQPVALVGATRACLPLPPFGTLAVDPIAFSIGLPAFDAAGSSSLCFTLTRDAALCGGVFELQAWFLDPGAAGAPLAHTDGCSFTFGSL
jgi:hypothetical protein